MLFGSALFLQFASMILGSNDGLNYSTIFEYDNNGSSIWTSLHQVVEFSSVMGDFAEQNAAFSIFRYEAYSVVNAGLHQLGELELFGDIPCGYIAFFIGSLFILIFVIGQRFILQIQQHIDCPPFFSLRYCPVLVANSELKNEQA